MSKMTTEIFKQKVFDLVGDEYTVLGTYENAKTKILIRHKNCNSEISILPSLFIGGTRCRKCFIDSRRKTHEQFLAEMFQLVGDEYIVLTDYISNGTKVEIQHSKCNHIYKVTPAHFLSGTRCPNCFGAHKKTDEQFKRQVLELVGNEYTFMDNYKTTTIKLPVKHKICGNEYQITPNDFLGGTRCPYCFGNIRKTTDQFKQSVKEKYDDEYTVIGEYINNRTKIKLQHNICGHKYVTSPDNFLAGYGCPLCAGNIKWTTDDFKKFVFECEGDAFEVLGEYVNSKTKILMRHVTCDFKFKTTLDEFRNGNRCPYCRESKGEKQITDFLSRHQISFIRQYRFEDCRRTRPLPFDFALFDRDKLIGVIEFHGRQHYEIIKAFGGVAGHEERKRNDTIKTEYCKAKSIPLIIIPYWELSNIDGVLQQAFSELRSGRFVI